MKRILLIILNVILIFGEVVAQNQNYYLTEAIKLLSEGNLESAERHYNLYKKMTSQVDTVFENLLEEKKNNITKSKSWKDDCYIITLNSDTCLAVQKRSISYKTRNWNDAVRIAAFSRLGAFSDWHIPSMEEMSIVLSNLSEEIYFCWNGNSNSAESCYWTTTRAKDLIVNVNCDNSIGICSAEKECNFVVVRKFILHKPKPGVSWVQVCTFKE